MNNLNRCPCCGSNNTKKHLNCRDNFFSKEMFIIRKCEGCKFMFTSDIPKELDKYYEFEEYISHTNSSEGFFNKVYKVARKLNIIFKLKTIGTTKQKLVEIGSGTGNLLSACQKKGWNVYGVEINKRARENAQRLHNIELKENLKNWKIEPHSVDVIMLWHVFEHLEKPLEKLAEYQKLLRRDGKIIIAVPNNKSYDATLYKEHWAAYDVPRHLNHFNKENMKGLVEKTGMKIVKTEGMLLDAFYISILSKKYKSGKSPLTGLAIGLLSNIKAMIKDGEYSSLIFTIKPK